MLSGTWPPVGPTSRFRRRSALGHYLVLPEFLFTAEIVICAVSDVLSHGYTALYGLITAITRQKLVSREADDVVRVDAEFKTSCSRVIDVVGRGRKWEWCRTRHKILNSTKFYPGANHGWHTW